MREKYEQMELNTAGDLEQAVKDLTVDTIKDIQQMSSRVPSAAVVCRSKHEAYGLAAEKLGSINAALKRIKLDADTLLASLPNLADPGLEAMASICHSAEITARIALASAAELNSAAMALYAADSGSPAADDFPLAELGVFQDVDTVEVEGGDAPENE